MEAKTVIVATNSAMIVSVCTLDLRAKWRVMRDLLRK